MGRTTFDCVDAVGRKASGRGKRRKTDFFGVCWVVISAICAPGDDNLAGTVIGRFMLRQGREGVRVVDGVLRNVVVVLGVAGGVKSFPLT